MRWKDVFSQGVEIDLPKDAKEILHSSLVKVMISRMKCLANLCTCPVKNMVLCCIDNKNHYTAIEVGWESKLQSIFCIKLESSRSTYSGCQWLIGPLVYKEEGSRLTGNKAFSTTIPCPSWEAAWRAFPHSPRWALTSAPFSSSTVVFRDSLHPRYTSLFGCIRLLENNPCFAISWYEM